MNQYHPPSHRAGGFAEINRPLTISDYELAMGLARQAGLHRFDLKNMGRMLEVLLQ